MPSVARVNLIASADWSSGLGAIYATPPISHTAGNVLVVAVGALASGGQSVTSVTDTAGNTYVKAGHILQPLDAYREEMWVATNVIGHTTNIVQATWSGVVAYRGMIVAQYSGMEEVAALDAVATGVAAPPTTTVITDTLTTTHLSDLHLLIPRWGLLDTVTYPSGFVNVSPHPRLPFAERFVGGALFAEPYTVTSNEGVTAKIALVIALKAALTEVESVLDQTLEDVSVVAAASGEAMVDGTLYQTLDDVVLAAFVEHTVTANLTQTLDGATVVARGFHTVTASLIQTLAGTQLDATAVLGDFSAIPVGSPRIYNLTGQVRDSGGAILCFVGPPNKTIDWRLLEGHGTLTPFTTFTDKLGRCSCRYDAAGFTEKVVVGAAYVP